MLYITTQDNQGKPLMIKITKFNVKTFCDFCGQKIHVDLEGIQFEGNHSADHLDLKNEIFLCPNCMRRFASKGSKDHGLPFIEDSDYYDFHPFGRPLIFRKAGNAYRKIKDEKATEAEEGAKE